MTLEELQREIAAKVGRCVPSGTPAQKRAINREKMFLELAVHALGKAAKARVAETRAYVKHLEQRKALGYL